MQTKVKNFQHIHPLTTLLTGVLMVAGLLLLFMTGTKTAEAANFIVDEAADDNFAHDANPGDGVCADSLGACTLRAAIEEANALPGSDTITFITQMTITLNLTEGPLPALSGPTIIDASSVWDTPNNRPGVVLHGNNINGHGLTVSGGNSGIYGLTVTDFGLSGIYVNSSNNTIGDNPGAGQLNVIVKNGAEGVGLWGVQAHHNIVQGNHIGLGSDGTTALGNKNGIIISGGAYSNTIGRSFLGGEDGNFISGNVERGIIVEGNNTRDNFILNNIIGVNGPNNSGAGNGWDGIFIRNFAANTRIGNDTVQYFLNTIVGNGQDGIALSTAGKTWIEGNEISDNGVNGISILNTADAKVQQNNIISNDQFGVYIFGGTATGNTINTNSISDNTDEGIKLSNGGNVGLAAPVITSVNGQMVSGTTCPNCVVEVFSDSADEGKKWEGWVLSDGSGQWSQTFPNPLLGPNLTATTIDPNGNTSEFSSPYILGGGGSFKIYLPGVFD